MEAKATSCTSRPWSRSCCAPACRTARWWGGTSPWSHRPAPRRRPRGRYRRRARSVIAPRIRQRERDRVDRDAAGELPRARMVPMVSGAGCATAANVRLPIRAAPIRGARPANSTPAPFPFPAGAQWPEAKLRRRMTQEAAAWRTMQDHFLAGFVPRMTARKSRCRAGFTFSHTKCILSSILVLQV